MSVQAATKSTDPGIVEQIEIFSNKNEGKSIDLTGGFSSLTYIESIMSDTIRVNLIILLLILAKDLKEKLLQKLSL